MRRLYRWLCCLTGHHRETVEVVADCTTEITGICTYRVTPTYCLTLRCMDCRRPAWISADCVRTPSRRYALRKQRAA